MNSGWKTAAGFGDCFGGLRFRLVKAKLAAEFIYRRRRELLALSSRQRGKKTLGVLGGPEQVSRLHEAGEFLRRNERNILSITASDDDWLVQSALRGLHATGMQPQTIAYRFCTNAAYSAGVAGVPTIGFGPATEADAHVIDECLSTDALVAAGRGYQSIIEAVLT